MMLEFGFQYPLYNTWVVTLGQLSSKQLNTKACKHQHESEEQNGDLQENERKA